MLQFRRCCGSPSWPSRMLSDGAYALVAGTAGDWLRGSARVRRWLSRFLRTLVSWGLRRGRGASGRPHD